MTSLQLLRKTLFTAGLCLVLFSDTALLEARAGAPDLTSQKYEVRIVKVPGEHEAGLREYIYEDGSVRTEEIPATGHIWSEWIIDIEPTITKEGHMYRVCEKIPGQPHYEERTIPRLAANKQENASGSVVQTHWETDASVRQSIDHAVPFAESVSKDNEFRTETSANQSLEADEKPVKDIRPAEDTASADVKQERNGFNAVDAVFIAGVLGASWFAYFHVMPLLAVLAWARRKRREILGE